MSNTYLGDYWNELHGLLVMIAVIVTLVIPILFVAHDFFEAAMWRAKIAGSSGNRRNPNLFLLSTIGNTYLGDCSWKPLNDPERSAPPNEVPTLTEVWLGREDQVETFRGAHAVGSAYLGGFIIDNTPRPHSQGMMSCDLKVALPPDFVNPLVTPGLSLKTSTLSAKATIDGDVYTATRNVTYYSPETRYSYFASSKPDDARYGVVSGGKQPRIIRSTISGSRSDNTPFEYGGGNAPAALVTALYMPPVDKLTGFDPKPIKGTPWYEVDEVVSRELQGDS